MLRPYTNGEDAHTIIGSALSSSPLSCTAHGAATMAAGLSSALPSFPTPSVVFVTQTLSAELLGGPPNRAHVGPSSALPEPPVNSTTCAMATSRADKGCGTLALSHPPQPPLTWPSHQLGHAQPVCPVLGRERRRSVVALPPPSVEVASPCAVPSQHDQAPPAVGAEPTPPQPEHPLPSARANRP